MFKSQKSGVYQFIQMDEYFFQQDIMKKEMEVIILPGHLFPKYYQKMEKQISEKSLDKLAQFVKTEFENIGIANISDFDFNVIAFMDADYPKEKYYNFSLELKNSKGIVITWNQVAINGKKVDILDDVSITREEEEPPKSKSKVKSTKEKDKEFLYGGEDLLSQS